MNNTRPLSSNMHAAAPSRCSFENQIEKRCMLQYALSAQRSLCSMKLPEHGTVALVVLGETRPSLGQPLRVHGHHTH